jgi:hypothetical protein
VIVKEEDKQKVFENRVPGEPYEPYEAGENYIMRS